MNFVAANNEGCAIISDDEVDLCSSSHSTRLSQASYFLWRARLKAAVSVNQFGVGSCIYLSKCRVAIGLQRRWRLICTKNTIFRNQFYSLNVLRDELVGIQRAFFVRVISLMESSLSRCLENSVNCQEVFRGVSISCVEETRSLSHHFIAAVIKAFEILPFPLDEDINMVFDDLIPLVNDSYELLINALRNIRTHSLEDLPQCFRHAYLDASSIDNLMTAVINRLKYILSLF